MVNETLKVLLETMAKNSPYTLGTDYAVSILNDDEKSFRINIFPGGKYPWFFNGDCVALMLAYANAFKLNCYVETNHNVPVVYLSHF